MPLSDHHFRRVEDTEIVKENSGAKRLQRLLHHRITAWAILAFSLLLTALAWSISVHAIRAKAEQRFRFQTEDIVAAIAKRLLTYETALRGGVGLFNASEDVTRQEWHRYVSGLRLQQNFPGIQGLGFSRMLSPDELERHQTEVRAEGFPDYAIRPAGERETYSAILYLEPFDWRNRRAFGYDMFSEPVRRAAMERARDSGEPAISGRVTLVQETAEDVQYGFLMYMPLYEKDQPLTTTTERRAALLGFVYSPFRVKDFLHGILGADQGGIDLELFDGATPSPATLLLHNRPEATLDALRPTASGERSALVRVPAGQHLWTLSLHTLPGYLSGADASQPLIVAVGGVIIDTFLFIIIASISRQQRSDERLSRQLREQLDDSEARYSALFKSARAVMLLIDPETGDILDANPAAERFYGYDQLRRMQIHDINPLPPDELQREMRRARQEQQEVFLFSHRLANGELRRVEVHSGPFRYGGRSALYSIIHDVTERERIAAALLASERRYAEVLAITGEGIWDWDILANRVTHNRRWLEILGSENLVGPHPVEEFADCLHEDDRAAVLAAIQEALAGRAPYVHQHRMRRADGCLIWVLDRGQVVERDADGAPRRMLGSLVDVTERMEHELVLKTERQRAEAANVAKSRFLATMSHEIRTPMNGILGMAQLLLMPQLAESDRLDYARIILDSGQTLLRLLNDILDFSKIEAGKVRLDPVAFRPNDLLQETQTLFSAAASSQALALKQDWRGPGDQGYRADSHRLRQMLSNLVGNAIKFTHQGGIRIEASEIARDDRTALLEFAVSDTGIGIAEQQQALLFQPFSQVDSATTRHYGGSGLGLSIVRSLARLMDGEVGVDSQAGTGSRFWFRIRADLVAKTEDPRGVDPSPAARPARFSAQVLVVEDDPVNRQIMQSLLNRLGVTVTLAEDGQQGLVAATTRETGTPDTAPDLVLMDCQMPVLDGYAATARIRHWEQENAQPHLPIIALTANVFDDDRRRCLNAGMDDFLGKPALFDDLVALLDRWLPATEASATTAARPDGVDQPADLARVTGLLAELRPLLEQHKFDALACCKDLEDAVAGTRLAAVVNGIGAPLASFRFDLALEQLRRLAEAEGWEC